MVRDSVYFFAEYPIEFAIWSNLAETILELDQNIRLELIFTKESRINGFNPEVFLNPFNAVHELDYVSHEMGGSWRQGFTPRNIYHSLTNVFPRARNVYSQLKQINFTENSVAFTYLGITLNQGLFLKTVKNRPGVESVLLLSADSTQESSSLTEYIVNYSQSLLLNFYFHFFGTAYMDVFWARVGESFQTNTREYVFREKPADYVFQSHYPFRFRNLQSGQVKLPLHLNMASKNPNVSESIVFIGQPHYFLGGFTTDVESQFYERINIILDSIREVHDGQHLIYKSHPAQTERQLSRINLDGFEIVTSGTSEGLFKENQSISTVYGFSSSSLQTALCYGIRAYYTYKLFDDILINLPSSVKHNWEIRWNSEYHPEMVLNSLEEWQSGKNIYSVKDISEEVRLETITLLKRLGINKLTESNESISEVKALSDQRWETNSSRSSFSYAISVILFIPRVVTYLFLIPARSFLSRLRLRHKH
ncbi:MAG: hypothetical protein CMG71_00825 [Candidatus Marinimicrobia bacterium]|nr:hypothetical protein [Candidatus Neomarinimicrobiota bacterium]|tara:strand:+ start:30081 stop:31517 length:1437 start_codon:yes stop_codon:yes gene_type:complete